MLKFNSFILNLVIFISLTFSDLFLPVKAQQRFPIRGGITFGISGMALLEQEENNLSLLVVHDNKGDKTQGRLAIISLVDQNTPQYFPLNWPDDKNLPVDLEALTFVPKENNFMAATSSGKIYHFSLNFTESQINLLRVFELPNIPAGSNFESFHLQEIDGKLLAIWGHRGDKEKPAIIYWGLLDLSTFKIKLQGSSSIVVPWPKGNLRHISDLKVDSTGVLYITAATDNGDNGPFQSAIYIAGVFDLQGNQVIFRKNSTLFPFYRFNHHKVEALELIPGSEGGILVGTDDENMGSSLLDLRF